MDLLILAFLDSVIRVYRGRPCCGRVNNVKYLSVKVTMCCGRCNCVTTPVHIATATVRHTQQTQIQEEVEKYTCIHPARRLWRSWSSILCDSGFV